MIYYFLKNLSTNHYLNENIFFKKLIVHSQIFITGLPRSGTTSILNFIYSSGEFASLKYSNMPFILLQIFQKYLIRSPLKKKKDFI